MISLTETSLLELRVKDDYEVYNGALNILYFISANQTSIIELPQQLQSSKSNLIII